MPAGEERKGKANPTPLSITFSSFNSARCPSGSKVSLPSSKPADNGDCEIDDIDDLLAGDSDDEVQEEKLVVSTLLISMLLILSSLGWQLTTEEPLSSTDGTTKLCHVVQIKVIKQRPGKLLQFKQGIWQDK